MTQSGPGIFRFKNLKIPSYKQPFPRFSVLFLNSALSPRYSRKQQSKWRNLPCTLSAESVNGDDEVKSRLSSLKLAYICHVIRKLTNQEPFPPRRNAGHQSAPSRLGEQAASKWPPSAQNTYTFREFSGLSRNFSAK